MIAHTGRIWEAVSTEDSRPLLKCVFFDAEKATLTATNSYIAARVPCEVEEGDESGAIPAEALKVAAGKSLKIAKGKATLTLPDGERTWKLIEGQWPDFVKAFDWERVDAPFGLNPKLLAQLGQAIRNDPHTPIAIHPVHPLRGIFVTGSGDAQGVIMPVRLKDAPPLNGTKPDLTNDDAVIEAAKAAVAALGRKRGKRTAAATFRKVLVEAQEVA